MKNQSILAWGYLAIAGLAIQSLDIAIGATFTAIVAPNDLSSTEGNSFGYDPFDVSSTGRRYQQVFEGSQFSAVANGGGLISTIGFRLDGSCQRPEGQGFPSFQINLSTTAKTPDFLSPVFSENLGLDDTIVRAPSQLGLVGVCSSSTPQSFTVLVSFDHPFF